MGKKLISENLIDSIKNVCKDNQDIRLTVGLYKKGVEEYHLFGCSGEELPFEKYTYEIGSITKTFTSYILGKAVMNGKVSLEDRMDKYIADLPYGRIYPTLGRLATHTAGYPADSKEFEERFEKNIDSNEYDLIDYNEMVRIIKEIDSEDKIYPAVYSNFGIGVLGYCLAQAYGKSIDYLIEECINEFALHETFIENNENILRCPNILNGYKNGKNLGNLIWGQQSIIGAAGFLCSTAEDMIKYGKAQFESTNKSLKLCHTKHAEFYRGEGVPLDIGLCWILIPDWNILWHNGGTRCFTSVLGIDIKNETVVVVLSNCLIEELTNIGLNQVRDLME